jgi:hypothetical protein
MSTLREVLPADQLAAIKAAADEAYEANPGSPLSAPAAERVRRILPAPAERQEAA